jgi:superkiller protein 3
LKLALLHQGRNEWREAEAALRTLIDIDPRNVNAQHVLAVVLTSLDQRDEAVAAYRRAAEIEPGNALRHLALGLSLHGLGRFDEAVAAYRKAIELDPQDAKAYGVLGDVLHLQDQDDEAVLAYRGAIAADPNFSGAHRGLGKVLRIQGKFAEAIAALEASARLGPLSAEFAGELAFLLATCPDATLRNAARAVELASRAVELEPGNASHCRALAAAHYRAGNWREALDVLERTAGLNPNGHGFDWFFAAMAHRQLDDALAAKAAYDQGCEWIGRTGIEDETVGELHKEAATLLGIEIDRR